MRILVVEDEKNMAELLKKGLEEESHRVSLAFNGPEALELAGLCEFDVIVLDVMLPRTAGAAPGSREPIRTLAGISKEHAATKTEPSTGREPSPRREEKFKHFQADLIMANHSPPPEVPADNNPTRLQPARTGEQAVRWRG